MDEKEVMKRIAEFGKGLPRFPDGRIDFSRSENAPVITVFVKYSDRILLLKRSDKVGTYRGKWNTVAGYLDELVPLKSKVLEELKEELGIGEEIVKLIRLGEVYSFRDEKVNKNWFVHPVMVELKEEPEIELDWEHTEYKWVEIDRLNEYNTVPNLDKSLKNVLVEHFEL